MTHKGTVQLETERLILRRFTVDDAKAMFKNWANDDEVTKYLTWPTHADASVSEAIIKLWVESYQNPNHYNWAIIPKEIGKPIGNIAIVKQREETNTVQFGYCIGQKWWNKGYTSEALKELIRFFFGQVGVNRIEAKHDSRNPNSGKVMQKCGLKYEGTLRQRELNNKEKLCDAVYYAILKQDYQDYKGN